MIENIELQKGWKWFPVKEIALNIQYGYTESSTSDNVGPKFLRITDIQNNQVHWDNVPYCSISDDAKQKYLLQDGDLVFARTGATVGKSFLIKGSIPNAVYASYLIRLRFPKEISDKFVWYYFQSPYYWNQIIDKQVGIGQPNVNGTTLGRMKIALCSLSEQHRIVAKIEELFSSLDKGIDNLKTVQQQLKVYRQAVLKWAFEGKLTNKNVVDGELPEGWKWVRSGDLFSFVTSGSRGWAKYYSKEGSVFIRITNLDFDTLELDLDESKIQYVDPPKNSEGIRTKVNEDDFLFSITGYLGMFAIAPNLENAFVNQHIALCRPKEGFNKRFVGYWIISRTGGHRYLNKMTKGATKAGLGLDDIKNFPVPLPSLGEQHAIIAEIESRLSVCDRIEKTINESLKQAEALRQSILKKAFEGKLVPQDPNDEPASLLLTRIKAEREKTDTKGSQTHKAEKTTRGQSKRKLRNSR